MPKPIEPTPSPSRRAQVASGLPPAIDTESESSPRTPADIPGLGPIRVRALQKAGLDSLRALRAAPLETLLAVPGLSEIKARQIQTFLARFPADAFVTPHLETEIKPEKGAAASSPVLLQWKAPSAQTEAASPLLAETVRTLGRTISLLLSGHAFDFRNRLLRGMERFAQRAESLVTEAPPLSAKDRERAMRRMRRISETFDEVRNQEAFDRKAQLKLAETLDETSDWLAALIAPTSSDRAKPTKEAHD